MKDIHQTKWLRKGQWFVQAKYVYPIVAVLGVTAVFIANIWRKNR